VPVRGGHRDRRGDADHLLRASVRHQLRAVAPAPPLFTLTGSGTMPSSVSKTSAASSPNGVNTPGGRFRQAVGEPAWVRRLLIAGAIFFLSLILLVPLVAVFHQAFQKGWEGYWEAISAPDTLSAIKLTLIACGIAVPLNVVFGVAAAWSIA